MSNDTTQLEAMASSDSAHDAGLFVIGYTFSSFGGIFASLGFWLVHGLVLALCFFGVLLAAFSLVLPIILIAERIFENTYAKAPSDERGSGQGQEQDLEANVGSLEGEGTTSVEQVPDSATEEARLIPNEPSDAVDTEMASRAPNDSTNEQIPLANISDPGRLKAGSGERATDSSDGDYLDMPSGSVDSDKGSDCELEEHDAHPGWPKPVKQVSFWRSVR